MEALSPPHPLFPSYYQRQSSVEQQLLLVYARAAAIGKASGVTAEDCVTMSKRYWDLNRHRLLVYDTSTGAIISIHYNLCLSTIARYARNRPDLRGVISKLENWDVNGQFMLTELGHGLDVINMETTATFATFPAEESGGKERKGFILHTPTESAQKWMPPTTPLGGIAKVAVVHARMIVNGEFRGIRMFLVPLTDGLEMCKGISSKFVGARGGNTPIDHALTRFTNVELPLNALLCATHDIESELFGTETVQRLAKEGVRGYFKENLLAVHPSKVALSLMSLSGLKLGTYIASKYSLWRKVYAKGIGNGLIPIMTFRTQQIPCAYGVAKSLVYTAWGDYVTNLYTNPTLSEKETHAVSAVFKQVLSQEAALSVSQYVERCGAQGLFEHNHLSSGLVDLQGFGVAEGDVLVVGIKVASDLIMGKYALPPPEDPSHILAQHEIALFEEARSTAFSLVSLPNRVEEYNKKILPICNNLLKAYGDRMAFEKAKEAGVDGIILDVFLSMAIEHDPAWYALHLNISQQQQREMQELALDKFMPHLEKYLDALEIADIVINPIISPSSQLSFHNSLPAFVGTSLQVSLFGEKILTSKL